jgi:nucleotide-binding universal stress UspA family protein
MDLRDLLVFLDARVPSDSRLSLAARIARDHGAQLDAVFVMANEEADFPPGLSVPRRAMMRNLTTIAVNDEPPDDAHARATECRYREQLRHFGLKGDWCQVGRANTDELIAYARAVDLIILGQGEPPGCGWNPERLVAKCGRPALVVPYAGQFVDVGRRVLIAWDGSREAVRAINDALPLMHGAQAVIVITAPGRRRDIDRDHAALNRITRHLGQYDIAARSTEALGHGYEASDILLSRAVDFAADLIVAGAHHHSRLREALTGGLSRGLFRHMTVPVLMSH